MTNLMPGSGGSARAARPRSVAEHVAEVERDADARLAADLAQDRGTPSDCRPDAAVFRLLSGARRDAAAAEMHAAHAFRDAADAKREMRRTRQFLALLGLLQMVVLAVVLMHY